MTIAHWDDVEPRTRDVGFLRFTATDLGVAAGTVGAGLRRYLLNEGDQPTPPHIHGAEEEIFVVLDGTGTLELAPSSARRDDGAENEEHEFRRGHVVSRPPGTGISHLLRAGDEGLTYLAYGTREP